MSEASRENQLDKVLHSYLQAIDAGQVPDREKLLRDHPELADDLRAFFADQAKMDQMAQSLRQAHVGELTLGEVENAEVPDELPHIRYFGDYELLEEIARGGMGVVYKARQVSLNRVVAVKMILAGHLASENDVRRFRAEAEAAANLDHPNILPIYEVGEYKGQHYFSMKLIAGGSLASRLSEFRTDPRAAVTLLTQVTRAVDFAHRRGVLHRDLKPANILLDSHTPYVADFGLAKRVEDESSGLTVSGAIVGTPSYMPPEQARAEKALTIAADVYSLGAILYELLSGRPPFRGSSLLDTLLQVQEQEPEPLRPANPGVARELETVCLKCLAKAPAARYASAGDLADEFERWLAGESVLACPPTPVERLVQWGRRNPVPLAFAWALLIGVGVVVVHSILTEGLGSALKFGVFATLFFTYMMVLGRSHTSALEKRLRGDRLDASVGAAAKVPVFDGVPRGDLLRAVWRGARNGLYLGAGVALALIGSREAWAFRDSGNSTVLKPEWAMRASAVAVIALLAGAVAAVLTRTMLRPFGPIAWGAAWLVAGIAVAVGAPEVWGLVLPKVLGRWQPFVLVIVPTVAVCLDGLTRYMMREIERATASGKISSERSRIAQGGMPKSDNVVKFMPVLLMFVGVIVGHFLGVPAEAEFGSLIGRVAGGMVGALVAIGVLRWYGMEDGTPWPGQADRPYPRALAALYLSVSVFLAIAWFV